MLIRAEALLTFPERVRTDRILPRAADIAQTWWTTVKSALIGVFVGSVPGAGCDVAAFAAYAEARRAGGGRVAFETGEPHGIAAPEAANNAATAGAMIPMLSLGVPGDAVTAVLLGALTIHGFEPGPVFFAANLDLVHAIFAGVILAQAVLLIVGLTLAWPFAVIIRIDQRIMVPAILFVCMIGAYAARYSHFDMWLTLIIGAAGHALTKARVPLPPLLLGIVLGQLFEQSLRRSLILSNDDPLIFVQRPISASLLAMAAVALVAMVLARRGHRSAAQRPIRCDVRRADEGTVGSAWEEALQGALVGRGTVGGAPGKRPRDEACTHAGRA